MAENETRDTAPVIHGKTQGDRNEGLDLDAAARAIQATLSPQPESEPARTPPPADVPGVDFAQLPDYSGFTEKEWTQLEGAYPAWQVEGVKKIAKAQRERKEYIARETERVLKMFPAWQDPAVRQRELAEIVEYARSEGYSDDEIARVADAKHIASLRRAARDRKREMEPRPDLMTDGEGRSKSDQPTRDDRGRFQAATTRGHFHHRKAGSLDAGAEMWERFLTDDTR